MPLDTLQAALDQLRAGELDQAAFCRRLRAISLPAELPPKFGEVLANLLDRLESSAMFGGESCSFSTDDLAASVQARLDKARERLKAA